ncbi:MAG: hypothetical protein KGI23_01485 [Patescibacteria group bacterium]|nr:hypothetical protein [Patescibacteria group bacterium]
MRKSPNKWLTVASVLTAIIVVSTALNVPGNQSPSPVAVSNNVSVSGEASLALTGSIGGTVDVGQEQTIHWISSNYSMPTVSVSLIRKIGDNPVRYKLVRVIATSTANDGSAVWVPAATDVGNNLSIEIGCAVSSQTCHGAISPSDANLAVVNSGRFANTAAAYRAIERENNK